MSEVVYVKTLEEWKSVLDVWFSQGYEWEIRTKRQNYFFDQFNFFNARYLYLNSHIQYGSILPDNFIEYEDFMAQQKEDNKMEIYYITQEQLDFLNTMYEDLYSLDESLNQHIEAKKLFDDFSIQKGNAVLRYLGGDTSIEFKVKEPLYRLWRINNADNKVYMEFNLGTPDWTFYEEYAFTAPLKEIHKWKTPAWEIEKVES